jgi:hypothetical protein
MKPRVYERTVSPETGTNMEYSDLFVRVSGAERPAIIRGPNGTNMPGHEERVISIEGTNGHIYTGFYIREDSMGRPLLHEGTNILRLGFRLGDSQSTKPLDDRVREHGFAVKE